MTGLEAIGAIAGKKAIEKVTEDIYQLVKSKASGALKRWKAEKGVTEIYTQLESIRMVKTLWQVDKAVDLADFYCYPHVVTGKSKRIKVLDTDDIKLKRNILIRGIAGQGKSILLRYLCARELQKGIRLPIFIELRRVTDELPLVTHLKAAIEILGIDIDEPLMKELAASGKLAIFLDGFDEVREDLKSKVVGEIEYISRMCKNGLVVVSSRPDSGIDASPFLDVAELDNLRGTEYRDVIYRLSATAEDATNLINQVEGHPGDIKRLLITPLLVTLLLVTYKSFHELPEQLSDFYDAVFQVLLKRHDGTKPGYKRERHCPINDKQHRDIFDAFCYESKRSTSPSFNYRQVYEFADASLARKQMKQIDAATFLEDIVKVTCLLVRDGEEYRFIHKSVQEYFTASYLATRPEAIIIKFYNSLLESKRINSWQQELRFLAEIDRFRYTKYFRLPLLRRLLGLVSDEKLKQPKATLKLTNFLLGRVEVIVFNRKTHIHLSPRLFAAGLPMDLIPTDKISELDFSHIWKDIDTKDTQPGELRGKRVLLGRELRDQRLKPGIVGAAEKMISNMYQEAVRHEIWLRSQLEEEIGADFIYVEDREK